MSAKTALYNHAKKDLKKLERLNSKGNRAKNKSPERDVEREILKLAPAIGLDLTKVDSKNTFNAGAGAFVGRSTSESVSDLMGNTNEGKAAYIEVKAPKQLRTLKPHQKEFLERKINAHCFAVCVDSFDLLNFLLRKYKFIENPQDKIRFLLNVLPTPYKSNDDNGLF